MLAIHLERAVSWDVRAASVTASYPTGTSEVNMPNGEDHRLLGNLASEILGRAVTFRATLLREDAAAVGSGPAQPKPPAQATGSQAGALRNIGTLADHPEIADFVRFFPGAKIEEQKRKS